MSEKKPVTAEQLMAQAEAACRKSKHGAGYDANGIARFSLGWLAEMAAGLMNKQPEKEKL